MRQYKKPGPVIYIDPSTNQPKCDPTICANKFTSYFEIKETNYKWVGGPVFHKYHYSICKECGTRTITSNDKKLTDISYKKAIDNNGKDSDIVEMLSNG